MRVSLTRSLVLDALADIIDGQEAADRALGRRLRGHEDLSSSERAAVARRVLGIACLRGRLDYLTRHCSQRTPATAHSFRLAAYLYFEEGMALPEVAPTVRLDPSWIAPLAEPVEWPTDQTQRLASQRSLPHWMAARWIGQYGYQWADALAASMNVPGPITVRVNTLKAQRRQVVEALAHENILAEPVDFAPHGLHLSGPTGRPNIFGSWSWRAGFYEVQDQGSQLVASLVGARPGERCVDFCAGAGGKTLALAAMMNNQGQLLALDVDGSRLTNLRARLARAGVSMARTWLIDQTATELPADTAQAQRVLVDAPCSSLGTLRRSPDLRWRLTPEDFHRFSRLQGAILDRASQCVATGGLLIYATCSCDRAENEETVKEFSDRHPQFSPVPASSLLGADLSSRLGVTDSLHLWPHVHRTDGFFGHAWRRAPR